MSQPYSSLPQNQPGYDAQYFYSYINDDSYGMGRIFVVLQWILIGSYALCELFGFGIQISFNGLDPKTTFEEMPVNGIFVGFHLLLILAYCIVFVATAICFVLWGYKLITTAKRLGAAGLRRQPYDAWVYFVIPLVNIFEPCNVYSEIWRACTPEVSTDNPGGWRSEPAPGFNAWWYSWLLTKSVLLGAAASLGLISSQETWQAYSRGLWVRLIFIALDGVFCYVLIRMVAGFAERIDARLDRLRELADERQISVSGLIAALHNTYKALPSPRPGTWAAKPTGGATAQPSVIAKLYAQAAAPYVTPRSFVDKLRLEKWLCLGASALYFVAAYIVSSLPDPKWIAVSTKGETYFFVTLWAALSLFVLYRGLWLGSVAEKWMGAGLFALISSLLLVQAGKLDPGWQQPTIVLYYAFAVPGIWAVLLFARDALALRRHEEADANEDTSAPLGKEGPGGPLSHRHGAEHEYRSEHQPHIKLSAPFWWIALHSVTWALLPPFRYKSIPLLGVVINPHSVGVVINFPPSDYVPPGADEFSLDLIEDPLIEAFEGQGLGEHDGNGLASDGECDIFLFAKRRRLVDAVREVQRVLRELAVPREVTIAVHDYRPVKLGAYDEL